MAHPDPMDILKHAKVRYRCRLCDGMGFDGTLQRCPACGGSGWVTPTSSKLRWGLRIFSLVLMIGGVIVYQSVNQELGVICVIAGIGLGTAVFH